MADFSRIGEKEMKKVAVKDVTAVIQDIAASDFGASQIAVKKKTAMVVRTLMPGLDATVLVKVFREGIGFVSSFGFYVPGEKKYEMLDALNGINEALLDGYFAINDSNEVYYYNFLRAKDEVPLSDLKACLTLGTRMFLSRVDEISEVIDDQPEEVSAKDGDGKYIIKGDD